MNIEERIILFKKSLYLWCIFNYLTLLSAGDFLFSSSSYISKEWMNPVLRSLGEEHFVTIIMTIILSAIYSIASRTNLFLHTIITILSFYIDSFVYPVMDGGNNIFHLFMIYLLLASPEITKCGYLKKFDSLNKILMNKVLTLCRLQLCIVYFATSMIKITGTLWPKGIAIYYSLMVPDYSIPLIYNNISHFPDFVFVLSNYLVLGFQLSFPYMIWNKRARPYYLAIGTMIHLSISFVIGLFLFGLVIAISYSLFYEKEDFEYKVINGVFTAAMSLKTWVWRIFPAATRKAWRVKP